MRRALVLLASLLSLTILPALAADPPPQVKGLWLLTEYPSTVAKPGETTSVKLKLQNTGTAAVKLDDLSTIIEGATNGGEAKFTTFENGSEPLEGRLAPGQTATKTDDNVLETQYGRKIVVTVQRSSENLDLEFPEFNGTITG